MAQQLHNTGNTLIEKLKKLNTTNEYSIYIIYKSDIHHDCHHVTLINYLIPLTFLANILKFLVFNRHSY